MAKTISVKLDDGTEIMRVSQMPDKRINIYIDADKGRWHIGGFISGAQGTNLGLVPDVPLASE